MFSLKFDLLFPTVAAAKELARKLNAPARPEEPREAQRRREELRRARDKLKDDVVRRRYPVF